MERSSPHSLGTTLATHPIAMSFYGALVIVALTQVRIPLLFTPVPITGQTFAVILWPLLFGRRAGIGAVGIYLLAGMAGLPVFSDFTALSALWGPTSGYLIGFLLAASLVGFMRDMNYTKTIYGAALSIFAAMVIILVSGASILSLFVGIENVWVMGIAPFLVGDAIKLTLLLLSSGIASWTAKN